MAWTCLEATVTDDVALITLNRPAKLNALNGTLIRELHDAIGSIDTFRALVITGNDRAFSAGADLAEGTATDDGGPGWVEATRLLSKLGVPTIAAIEGWCLGGGLELALCCDLRVASEAAKLGTPEVKRGIFPGGGGTQRLPRLIGPSRAKELMFLGDHIDAQTALDWGLINAIAPVGKALHEALAIASRLATGATLSIGIVKGLVDDGLDVPLADGLKLESVRGAVLDGSSDVKEGIAAFLEKREPRFTGR